MIPVKTREEIRIMHEGGRITKRILRKVLSNAKPGVNLKELDGLAEELVLKAKAKPSFKTVRGYNFSTCINVNEGVVHGVPRNTAVIRDGDLVSLDLGVYYKGFHTDSARTRLVVVPESSENTETVKKEKEKFLAVGETALKKAIRVCRVGNTIGDIGYEIQSTVEGAGYSVVRDLIGHGVGRDLHEPPQVPGFGKKNSGPKILEGMVLAIEVIYTMGSREVTTAYDGWTIESADKSLAGLFEHTVAVVNGGPLVLT